MKLARLKIVADKKFVCKSMSVCLWSGRLGFNPRSSHTKDSKNGS